MLLIILSSQILWYSKCNIPDSNGHGANMGPTWVLSAPGGPHAAPWTLLSGILCLVFCRVVFYCDSFLISSGLTYLYQRCNRKVSQSVKIRTKSASIKPQQNTVEDRYNAVQYSNIMHTPAQAESTKDTTHLAMGCLFVNVLIKLIAL